MRWSAKVPEMSSKFRHAQKSLLSGACTVGTTMPLYLMLILPS
jgi:hypothetical protein